MSCGGRDVFISYRREGGAATARLIRQELEKRGFTAFIDVDDLGPSHFDNSLLEEIERDPNFIVILSRDALKRCANQGDWLRQEIAHALATERRIVPVIEEGFAFPPKGELPPDIAELPRHQAVLLSFTYFNAAIDKLVGFLEHTPPLPPSLLSETNIEMGTTAGETSRIPVPNSDSGPALTSIRPLNSGAKRHAPPAADAAIVKASKANILEYDAIPPQAMPDFEHGDDSERLQTEIDAIRYSAVRRSDLFGGIILATAGLALPFLCRNILARLWSAVEGNTDERKVASGPRRYAFRVSMALSFLGTLPLLVVCPYMCMEQRMALTSAYFWILIPLILFSWLGFVVFSWWLFEECSDLMPELATVTRRCGLVGAETRRSRLPIHLVKALAASAIVSLCSLIVLLVLMRDILFTFRSMTPSVSRLIVNMALLLATFSSLFLAISGSVKDVLTEVVWPQDNTFTPADYFRDETRRSPAHWYNVHDKWPAIYACLLLFIITVVLQLVRQ